MCILVEALDKLKKDIAECLTQDKQVLKYWHELDKLEQDFLKMKFAEYDDFYYMFRLLESICVDMHGYQILKMRRDCTKWSLTSGF